MPKTIGDRAKEIDERGGLNKEELQKAITSFSGTGEGTLGYAIKRWLKELKKKDALGLAVEEEIVIGNLIENQWKRDILKKLLPEKVNNEPLEED